MLAPAIGSLSIYFAVGKLTYTCTNIDNDYLVSLFLAYMGGILPIKKKSESCER